VKALRDTFEPVKRTKVYAEVASQISRLIEAGRFKPGDRLPPERDLAEMFGVSRTSVRDAIRVLEMRGFVEPRHGEGTLVKQVPIDAIVGPLADALVSSKNLTADLFDMRKMLEPPLARAASLRATAEDLKVMKDILKRQAERVRAGEIAIEEDNAFHYQIATAARNQVVLAVMDLVMELLQESRARSLQGPGRAGKSLDGHRRILFAIRNGDPDLAAEAMRLHIEEIEQVLSPRESSGGDQPVRAEAARGETAHRIPNAPSRVRSASAETSVSGRTMPGRGGVEWRARSR
jgi:GntR family transcriptional regulator, transcriptional repressor for pyruvate dehydrogenase complex